MIGRLDVLTHPAVSRVIIRQIDCWLDLGTAVAIERWLLKNLSRELEAGAPVLSVLLGGKVIKENLGFVFCVRAGDTDRAAALGFVGPHMHLKSMAFESRLAVVADRGGQKVVLDIGRSEPRAGANKPAGLKVIGRAQPGFGEYLLHANA